MTADGVREFLVPDLGEGLEDVTVVCWNVGVGDVVELNQPLCSVETAKAEVEIPSPYAGRVVEIRGAQGDTLDVGSLLIRIDCEADAGSAPSNGIVVVAENGATNGSAPRKAVLVGYGADGDIDVSRRPAGGGLSEIGPMSDPTPPGTRPRAAPSVRKLAAEMSIDLAELVPGSGPGGLIMREDVLRANDKIDASGSAEKTGRAFDVMNVGRVHARMAARMALSRREIPDAHASMLVDCTSLLRLRDGLRAAAGDNGQLMSTFVLTMRLLIVALSHNRMFNSTWVETPSGPQVHSHVNINLGFGVATQRGLLVPVIADAGEMSTLELGARVAELIRGAREGSLKPKDMQGSTFTISNYGALGLEEAVPVINYPEAAILGMGSLRPRPAVIDDAIVIRQQMMLTCAFDHRIVDGAQVAQLLNKLRQLIEAPEMALLDL